MYKKEFLITNIEQLNMNTTDTLLIHSSMKSIGEVDGGADTVLDSFMEYLSDGLLILPTHTWGTISDEHNIYDYRTEPSCVGVLTNVFRKREGVIRSLHPTHSVAAYGKNAEEYVSGEENTRTPCPRNGCWGRLYDMNAKILFLGARMRTNTIIHGAEEWFEVPGRLMSTLSPLKCVMRDGSVKDCPQYRHNSSLPEGDISHNYDKLEKPFIELGIAKYGIYGDAKCIIYDVVSGIDFVFKMLNKNQDLFLTADEIPQDWYK